MINARNEIVRVGWVISTLHLTINTKLMRARRMQSPNTSNYTKYEHEGLKHALVGTDTRADQDRELIGYMMYGILSNTQHSKVDSTAKVLLLQSPNS